MDKVCEELDEVKAELERLTHEHQIKTELFENLKKAHNEQYAKLQEANLRIEKQDQEINLKAEEITCVTQSCKSLQVRLAEKESIISHLLSTKDKLRVYSDEKFRKLEEGNRELVLSLDEANTKCKDQEQVILRLSGEIESLKSLLSGSQKKCAEAERRAKAQKELRQRDDMLLELEDEKKKVEDALKWKKEQFKHLEEAYEKLHKQFQESKKEWESEKSALLDDMCCLQEKLDSQTRVSEDLQCRLQFCNQALAHEESRRKSLEVQLAEADKSLECVSSEWEEARSKIECLTTQRDKDIATLRNSLAMKETVVKELEYRQGKLEQDNVELRQSLKELQESQIQGAASASSLAKLRNKLKGLEQVHKNCSMNLKNKEAEWNSQLERLKVDLDECRSEICSRDLAMEQLQVELQGCHSATVKLAMQYEEASLMLMVLKAGFSEARVKVYNEFFEMKLHYKEEFERTVALLSKQLIEAKGAAEEACGKVTSLSMRVESMDHIQWQLIMMQEEVERLKMELEDCHSVIAQLALQNEEASIMLLVLKAGFSEARMKVASKFEEMNLHCREQDKGDVALLRKQLIEAQRALEQECGKVAALSSQLKSLVGVEEQQIVMQQELERLKMELEGSHSLMAQLALQNEEASVMLLVLKVGFSEARRKLIDEFDEMHKHLKEESEANFLLKKQLILAQKAIEEEHDKVVALSRQVESMDSIDNKKIRMQEELETYKMMLEEFTQCQLCFKEQVLKKEHYLKQKLKEVCNDLDRTNSELIDQICKGNEIEFELQIWKFFAERLEVDLEDQLETRKALEGSLFAELEVVETLKKEQDNYTHLVQEKDKRIDHLQQQIVLLDRKLKTEETENGNSARMKAVKAFKWEIEQMEQECMRREIEGVILTQTKAEKTFEEEKHSLLHVVEAKVERIDELTLLTESMEQKLSSSVIAFSSQLMEKQAEIDMLRNAWEDIITAEVLAQVEIQQKNLVVDELESEVSELEKKLQLQEKSLSDSKRQVQNIESELLAQQLETKKLQHQLETKSRTSATHINDLETEKKILVKEIARLSSGKEILLEFIRGLSNSISQLSREDMQLMGVLETIVQTFDDNNVPTESHDHPSKENANILVSPGVKKFEATSEERPPFRLLNE
ncbi:hypothetical protein RJ641_010039 [Dillenia turbinata]|uniref:Uncharacterized protein n=1 Tax=Dillenia turbinata TaxID=194707 RepID=A0AAN8V2S3_9MAGN